MPTYSKAAEQRYSPDLRRQLPEHARSIYREQIASALEWVSKLAVRFSLAGKAMKLTDGV